MLEPAVNPAIAVLRERIRRLEGSSSRRKTILPFGVDAIDGHLPGGGLALGALHEVTGGGGDEELHAAAAALFAAGIAARTRGKVLWCMTKPDLFAPALDRAGLAPGRVMYAECGDEQGVFDCFEEGLRCSGFGAVIGELAALSMVASRRLQLLAESSGVPAIAIRRWRRPGTAVAFSRPTASVTRWRVSVRPSASLPVPGIGRARWHLELVRCRGAESMEFEVEACDAKGRLALSADMADGSFPAHVRHRVLAG